MRLVKTPISALISDLEFEKFGIKEDKLSFSEFLDIVSNELSKQTLNECIELAEKYGLSKMTMDEISEEVKAVGNAPMIAHGLNRGL